MYVILWEYIVPAAQRAEFERTYGAEGKWVELFRQGGGYAGTELYRDEKRPERYISLDRWASGEAYERFMHEHQSKYDRLDEDCSRLTEQERALGSFSRT